MIKHKNQSVDSYFILNNIIISSVLINILHTLTQYKPGVCQVLVAFNDFYQISIIVSLASRSIIQSRQEWRRAGSLRTGDSYTHTDTEFNVKKRGKLTHTLPPACLYQLHIGLIICIIRTQ